MSSKIDRRMFDASAAALGGGVGLAVLESMFSLVQSQSILNAAMVRDYQLAQPLAHESLALALHEILSADGGPGGPVRRPGRTVRVRRRPDDPDAPDGFGPAGGGGGGDGGAPSGPLNASDPGASQVAALTSALGDLIAEIKSTRTLQSGAGGQNTSTTTRTSEHIENAAHFEEILHEWIQMLDGHLADLTEVNKSALSAPGLMVT